MSGLPTRGDDASINGIDVREQGSALRVVTNTPHLVSLGTGRLSTAVTLHPIKQGRVTVGSDPTCDIYVAGTGVCSLHCRVENSHGVVTLYPTNGCTLLDGLFVDRPTRLSQGSMLTIGRSNYLRFNHPEEAKLMKSVLPGAHLSMAPVQFTPNEECGLPADYSQHHAELRGYQPDAKSKYNDGPLDALERELDLNLKDLTRRKPPVAPRKPYKDLDQISDSNSDQESLRSFGNEKPKSSIMAKVSKFEYYAKQQKIGRSQFYTNEDYSPKVFSSNSLTVNTPAKDVLGGKNAPSNYKNSPRVMLNESNAVAARGCAYANVMIKNRISKVDDIAKNFDDQTKLKKVNNVPSEKQPKEIFSQKQMNDAHAPNEKQINAGYVPNEKQMNAGYVPNEKQMNAGYVPNEKQMNDDFLCHAQVTNENYEPFVPARCQASSDGSQTQQTYNKFTSYVDEYGEQTYGRINLVRHSDGKHQQPSASFDRNPQCSPACSNPVFAPCSPVERSMQAESMRLQAYTERLNDEKEQEAESARLEEILSMCAEYERQITCGTPSTPTEKRSQNKIITNGSLPRTIINNPNFVQTSDGYFKFDTSQNRLQNSPMSKSLPLQRNLSNYENLDISPSGQKTPQLTIRNGSNYENVGHMDEIGIPITDFSSPILMRKSNLNSPDLNSERSIINSPIASPYENVFYKSSMKPMSPNTQSPRTRIRTTFAHKNVSPPQYFIFPTPPPIEDDSKMLPNVKEGQHTNPITTVSNANNNVISVEGAMTNVTTAQDEGIQKKRAQNNYQCFGIEKQLSLDEEIPMIDDSNLTNDLESRTSQITPEPQSENELKPKMLESHLITLQQELRAPNKPLPEETNESQFSYPKIEENVLSKAEREPEPKEENVANFDDVRKELMADIPELDEFERDLVNNQRECTGNGISTDLNHSASDYEQGSDELKTKYDNLKESRRQVLTEIHKMKCKMTDIRSQEDDILRDLEMEKALIKGEYDSEIAILSIEQRSKQQLLDRAERVEEEMAECKGRQEERQRELQDRVEIATLKVERIEQDLKKKEATIEELQNARDILDNETKLFEDLEFQHLEEESEMLAYREDLQNEIIALTKKIESQKSRILTLKSEANNNLTSALDETRVLQADYVQLLNKVEIMTSTLQSYEKELKDIAFNLKANSAKSQDSKQPIEIIEGRDSLSSDSDDPDVTNYNAHQKQLNEKFQSIDRMSQSMIVELGEKRQLSDLIDAVTINTDDDVSKEGSPQSSNGSPSKGSTSPKERKGFWERNFDSLSRLKNKRVKTVPKVDIMSQSLNENMFFNHENIESDFAFQKCNSLKMTKNKNKQKSNGIQAPVKSSSSSKIPTFAALGKIIKKDSVNKKKEESVNKENINCQEKNRYVKNSKSFNADNKYSKAKIQVSPEKNREYSDNERCSYADSLEGEIEGSTYGDSSNSKSNTQISPNRIDSNHRPQQLYKVSDPSFSNGPKILHRKSCGDEPGVFSVASDFAEVLSDAGKVPSQDDIDRISMVTLNAPLLSSDADKNSMGRRTLDSLMEIQRNRVAMLEKEGCQLIENEREKISELKRRVQNETKMLWESERETNRASCKSEPDKPLDSTNDSEIDTSLTKNDHSETNETLSRNDHSLLCNDSYNESRMSVDGFGFGDSHGNRQRSNSDAVSSAISPDNESSGMRSSSIEELQARLSRTDSRPLSDASDVSNDNALPSATAGGRGRSPYSARTDLQRPLTRYLPIDREDFDLRQHIESAGHQVEVCPHVIIDRTSCRGYLHKLGAKFHTWSKRWFVFDRDSKTFIYYSDKSEKKPRGGAYFQVIEEVYLDHGNSSRSPNPQMTFVVKTRQRRYYLMSPSGEAARIWIDVIFTGAQGYMEY